MGKRVGIHPTRQKILYAAADLMWQHGYRRTSPSQVMGRADVGQGSFYHHFRDKRSLGLAVVEHLVDRNVATLNEIFSPNVAPLRQVHDWMESFANRYRPPCDRGCPLAKIGHEMACEDPLFREAVGRGFAEIRKRLIDSLQRAADAGQLRPQVSPTGLAEMLLAVMQGAVLLAHCDGDGRGMDQGLAQLRSLLRLCTTNEIDLFD